jgi:hypothetical protein
VRSGGHNAPTRKLEVAFKVAGGVRAGRKDGCYAPPRRMAALIYHWGRHLDADVADGFRSVTRPDVVYVIAPHSSCQRMVFALRDRRGLFILDTAAGEVYRRGVPPERRGAEARRLGRGPLRRVTFTGRLFELSKADRARRLVIRCPRGSSPLGGGMRSDPPGTDGEGVYPHSYERLGVQRGFHVTALIIDPSPHQTAPRAATLQVICGRGLVPMSSPHRTVFVRRNSTNTAIATCPQGQYLFSGGFQRTNFTTPFLTYGGNYITESRAISPTAWRVTAHSVGWDGGELTAIAYCARDSSLPLSEVQASSPIEAGRSGTATTPPCPPGFELTSGGFSFNDSQAAFFADGSLDDDGTWSATGFGYFGPVPSLTAYGYCLRPADAGT